MLSKVRSTIGNLIAMKVLVLLALLFVTAGGSTATAQQLIPVLVGVSGHSINYLPAIIAREEGFTAKYGLDVTHLVLSGGTPTVQGLVAGEFDIALDSTTAVHGRLRGFDPVIVASFVPHMPYHLITRPEIQLPDDLRGGRLAISTPGSISDGVTRLAVERLGLVPERDVAILPIGGQTARLAALDAGTVDGTVVSPPLSYELVAQGYNMLLDLMAEQIPSNHENVITTDRVIREKRDLLKRYIKAIGEGLHYIRTNREGTLRHMANYLEMDLETYRPILERTYEEYVAYNIPKKPYPLLEGIKNALEIASLQNPDVLTLDPNELIDASIVQELDEEGFFDALYE